MTHHGVVHALLDAELTIKHGLDQLSEHVALAKSGLNVPIHEIIIPSERRRQVASGDT